jgi:hypothetical protein
MMGLLGLAMFLGSLVGVSAQSGSGDDDTIYSESGQTFVMVKTMKELVSEEGVKLLEELYKKGFSLEFVQLVPIGLLTPDGAILIIGRSASYK